MTSWVWAANKSKTRTLKCFAGNCFSVAVYKSDRNLIQRSEIYTWDKTNYKTSADGSWVLKKETERPVELAVLICKVKQVQAFNMMIK